MADTTREESCVGCGGDGVYQDEDRLVSLRCPSCAGEGTVGVYALAPEELGEILREACRIACEYWDRGWTTEAASCVAAAEMLARLEAERAP